MAEFKGGPRQWNFAVFQTLDEWRDWLKSPSGSGTTSAKVIDQLGKEFKHIRLFDEARERIEEIASNIDLGGAFEKDRLKITDNPSGVFDFGLASLGLQRLIEFYSQTLADEYPDAFAEYEALAGIVPNVLVDKNEFEQYYVVYNGKKYILEKRQKGTTIIQRANPSVKLINRSGVLVPENATDPEVASVLGFTSVQKKSYIEFNKKSGRTPYIDLIVPLNFLVSSDIGLNSLTAILPAVMAAKFFERAGIGTRIWAGRIIAETRGDVPEPFDGFVVSEKSLRVAQPQNPVGNQPQNPLLSIPDITFPDYYQVKPVKNRSALILLKQRFKEADYNAIGQTLVDEDGKVAVVSTALDLFRKAGARNTGNTYNGRMVWYAFPSAMNMVGNVFGKYQNYISKNNLWGDRAKEGSYMIDKFDPSPEELVLGTWIALDSYDIEKSIQDGTILLHNHPFGYSFWLIIDRAEMALGTDEGKIITRVFKRLTKEGYTPEQIEKYLLYVAYLAFNNLAVNPLESLRAYKQADITAEPSEYYPANPQTEKFAAKKQKAIMKAFRDMISRQKP